MDLAFDPVALTPWIIGLALVSAILALLARRPRIAAVLIGIAVLAAVIAVVWTLADPSGLD